MYHRIYHHPVARQERALILEIGLVQTHVHLLIRVQPGVQLPRLLQRLKGGSANVATREGHTPTDRALRWAKGYAIVSVGPAALRVAREYVRGQATRHPTLVIPEWEVPDSIAGALEEEWISEGRTGLRAGRLSRGRRERR